MVSSASGSFGGIKNDDGSAGQSIDSTAFGASPSTMDREKYALDWCQNIVVGSASAKSVLTAFCIVGNTSHRAYISIRAIAQRTELQPSTIRKGIKSLLQINALSEMPAKPNGVRSFRINVFWSQGVAELQAGRKCKGSGVKTASQNLTESKSNKKEGSSLICFVSGCRLPDAWGDLWLEYVHKRKSDGNRLTKSVATDCLAILRSLEAQNRNVRQILKDAIARGWKAFDERKILDRRCYLQVQAILPAAKLGKPAVKHISMVEPVAERADEEPFFAELRVHIADKLNERDKAILESAAFQFADPGLRMFVHYRNKERAEYLADRIITPAMRVLGKEVSWTAAEVSTRRNPLSADQS